MARQWYEKAAAQGNACAQCNLGDLYYNGQGVPQDYDMARQWYEKAAAQGNAYAQNNLGILYAQGNIKAAIGILGLQISNVIFNLAKSNVIFNLAKRFPKR